jgi:uncharacterized repeat protein (TIGR03803 family)
MSGSALIQGSDGLLYGTTISGGVYNLGTVFQTDLAGNLTILHSFSGYNSAKPGASDAASPIARLFQSSDGSFYSVSYAGGIDDLGTVYKIDGKGNVTLLHAFSGPDGSFPFANLVQDSVGALYGSAFDGGAFSLGTIFKIDTAGNFAVLHDFSGADGAGSTASLIALNGLLYGAAYGDGTSNHGTIFALDPANSDHAHNLTVLHQLANPDGSNPTEMLLASDGNFYGVTAGGAFNSGTLFMVTPAGAYTTLYLFNGGLTGKNPVGGLIEDSGYLYGTASEGGSNGQGVIFRFDPVQKLITVMHTFGGSDGANPNARLLKASDGKFYGTTYNGGVYSAGTIFQFDPAQPDPSQNLKIVHSFGSPAVSGKIVLPGCVNLAQTIRFEFRPQGGTPFVRMLTLDRQGGFNTVGLPAGKYNLAIKGSKWLQKVVPIDLTTNSATGLKVTLPAGDVVEDNRVDLLDMGALETAYYTRPGDANWNPQADLNCDGIVNIFDLGLMADSFLKSGDP